MVVVWVEIFGGTAWSWPYTITYAVVTLIWLLLFLVTVAYWLASLKVVSALIAAPVAAAARAARTEARSLEKSGAAIEAARWRTEIEAPTRRLAKETLLILNKGWGTAVGCVSTGITLVTTSAVLAFSSDGFSRSDFCKTFPLMLLPPLVVVDSAITSSRCAQLEDQINDICGYDTSFAPSLLFLKYLKALNRDQGLVRTIPAVPPLVELLH